MSIMYTSTNEYSCDCCQEYFDSILPIEQVLVPTILNGEKLFFCKDCADTYDFSGIYNPYNALDKKPVFVFNPNDKLLGVEWELNSKFSEEDNTLSIENLCHLKEFFIKLPHTQLHWDQSIEGDGIEAVFSPKTFKDNIKYFSDLAKKFKHHKKYVGNLKDCGVHIHVSKNHFINQQQIDLFMLLFHVNRETCYTIAQRKANFYAKLEDLKSIKEFNSYYQQYVINSNNHKRVGVHAENLNTVEVRIFKSTKNIQDIIQYLTFTQSIIDKTISYDISSISQLTTIDMLF